MLPIINRTRAFFLKNKELILFNLILVVIFFPITYQQAVIFDTSDYGSKLNVAKYIDQTGEFGYMGQSIPTPFFYIGIIFFKRIFGFSYSFGQMITILLCYPLIGNIIYSQLKKVNNAMNGWKGMLVTFGIIIAAPLFFFVFKDQHFYFGYIGLALYHNPTIILLRPFALILWLLTLNNFFRDKLIVWETVFGLVALIVVTIIKPSYTLCIFPGMGIVFLWQLFKRRKINWWYAIIVFFVPALLVLGRQYFVYFQNQVGGDSKIIFAPFKVISWMSDYILPKYILSILFPLTVSLIFFKKVLHDRAMVIAWLIFGIGTIYGYLLAQTGSAQYEGNFLWSTQITLFILFFQSIIFFLAQDVSKNRLRLTSIAIWSVLAVQVVCGIIYYVHCFIDPIYI